MRAPESRTPALWLCADLDALPPDALIDRVRLVASHWPSVIWLRSRLDAPARVTFETARALRIVAETTGSQLWIGDRCDVAMAVDAHGIHVGSRGLAAAQVRALAPRRRDGSAMRVSVAVHDAWGVRDAARDADVLMLSPFGVVPDKGGALGVAGFAACVTAAPAMPFVALGGIVVRSDVEKAMRAGATGFAVRRALVGSDDPIRAIGELVTP